MIFTLALRSLVARPIRSAVLAGGFGLGVAVMAALLGIGGVILEQARAPELAGGGDVIIGGAAGRVASARYVLTGVLGAGPLASRVVTAAPTSRSTLYLIDDLGATPVRARGGIPSLERALDDPETSAIASWTDTPADRAWAAPDPEDVLRAMDRFHPIPDVPARADSWAEWLYFNGRAETARFYLAFLAGPRAGQDRRSLVVSLQLERDGRMSYYSETLEVDEAELLASAPDITAGRNTVRLVGREYRITIDLPAETGAARAAGELVVRATPGGSLAPFQIRGAAGWVFGYVVPVMAGELEGTLRAGGEQIDFSGGSGYHDHNWGFWQGVTWQWGQVQGGGLSFVYGRVFPPPDAADAGRLPGFLAAVGPDGPVGYATDVTIDETNDPDSGRPRRIVIRARSESLSLTLDLTVDQTAVTRMSGAAFGSGMNFLQLRARYHVTGQVGDAAVDFTAAGSAETFRAIPQR